MEKPPTPGEDARKSRSDGVQSRERLLLTAMRLFAEQGFARTSTREIALAAGTNVASISYYFGDKAGLYRAAFTEPSPCLRRDRSSASPVLPLRAALHAFYAELLEPLKQGDLARLAMRLWYREMLEPTGLWEEEIDSGIKPAYAELVQMLGHHLQAEHDDDLARLAFSIVGMAMQLMVARDVIEQIRPQLLATDAAIDTWMSRLAEDAEALVQAEQRRRAARAPTPSPRKNP